MIKDADLKEHLFSTVKELFEQPARLQAMARAMHAQARPQAANQIAGLLKELAAPGGAQW
jgi:UDP-N-acetylglucosamine:LPS N-acetylglucosamine transferase